MVRVLCCVVLAAVFVCGCASGQKPEPKPKMSTSEAKGILSSELVP